MNLSIIHVITTIDLGGAEKQLLILAQSQNIGGAKVEVIFLKSHPSLLEAFRRSNIKVSTEFYGLNFFRQLLLLRRKASSSRVVFHAHLPRSELLCALALRPKSFVVTRHNSEPFFLRGPRIISRFLSRFVLSRAKACIAISQAVADFLQNEGELTRSTKVFIIYYGLSRTIVEKRVVIKQEKQRKFEIGTVARLVPQKNVPLLLEAMQMLKADSALNCHLTIAGTGPLREELKLMSLNLGIELEVTWMGQIHEAEELYRQIDLFVLSSSYEGFGLVLLEAMAFGVPVVARRISAIPEVLGERHPGLIESDDPKEMALKIKELLTVPGTREKCLDYQSQQLAKFSIQSTRTSHNVIYKNVLGQNS